MFLIFTEPVGGSFYQLFYSLNVSAVELPQHPAALFALFFIYKRDHCCLSKIIQGSFSLVALMRSLKVKAEGLLGL
ncbi:hypothetical protein GDO78_015008 [Eleutherodactylus coqui]|uniref:Uncharacterized protein n=1 Tax=Eleutherodactylus coqui TaxID=57060 RepID=A0A8J6EQC4_ELECQ|nr:hypothetical protein GDO78_015008 [Eleutherodactylus coqui]